MLDTFFTKVVDEEWGTYYNPTGLGYTLIAVSLILLILIAVLISGRKGVKIKTKTLAFSSVALALAFVTSEFLKLVHMPMGGSVTLFSMLFVTLIGYWYGLRVGLLTAVAYGLLQLVVDPWIVSVPQVLFDYILAFGALGLSGIFSNKKHGLLLGYITGVLGRFVFAFISGLAFFASNASSWNMSAPLYSFCYNGAYIGAEAAGTIILLLIPAVKKAMVQVKNLAISEE